MGSFQQNFENIMVKIGTVLGGNKYLRILRHSFMALLPLTIAGSLSLIITNFPFIERMISENGLEQIRNFFTIVSRATLSLVALYLAGAIGYYFAKEEKEEPLYGLIVSVASFLILTPLELNFEGNTITNVIPMRWLGGNGLFVAMVVGLTVSYVFIKLWKSKWTIKLPDSVPPSVTESFRVLFPAIIVFTLVAGVNYLMEFTSYGNIHQLLFEVLQTPLMNIGTTLPASIIVVIFIQLMWFVGLHGQNIAGAVMNPIWDAAGLANLEAVNAGYQPEFIFTRQFFSGFIWMQFIALIIACLIFARSKQLKAVGKLSIGSAIFNISEPIVFGSPVVLNIMLLIPWVFNMVASVIITWAAMASGLVPLPIGAVIPWTVPPIFSGWMITGSPMGAVLQVVLLAAGVFIYLPFIKMYDKQLVKSEREHESYVEETKESKEIVKKKTPA